MSDELENPIQERHPTLYKVDAGVVGMKLECPFCQDSTVEVEIGCSWANCENEECGAKYGIDDAGFLGLAVLNVRVEGAINE